MQNSSLENGFGTRSDTWMSLKVFLAMAMINSLDTATGCCSICYQWWKNHR